MASDLEAIFRELGLLQYLDAFVEQGFDDWDIILDIQESDLDALGVKLGHRRKLQRRIANARGISPTASLVSPARLASEECKPDGVRPEPPRADAGNETHGVQKRKYRRHPKSDPNAPERPPSAYVLFSNKMREDLKNQSLSFTEIAKLVGENWQSLPPNEKEWFESHANNEKEKYQRDMSEYKKTEEYAEYMRYLHEFKEKQNKQAQPNDVSKRPKLEPPRLRHSSSSSTNTPNGNAVNGNGSNGERVTDGEPSPSRKERMNSVASIPESQHSSTAVSQANSVDECMSPTRTVPTDGGSPRDTHQNHQQPRRRPSWREGGKGGESPRTQLPSLSDMLDDGRRGVPMHTGSEGNPYTNGFVPANHPRSIPEAPPILPGPSRAPPLRHEQSSSSSIGSMNSANGYARRPPGEGSLPIHALLSHQAGTTAPAVLASESFERGSPMMNVVASPSPIDGFRPSSGHGAGPKGYDMRAAPPGDSDVLMTATSDVLTMDGASRARLDGVSALLQAGEIVGRHVGGER